MSFFQGRQLLIATQHAKEKVIAPLLEQALGVRCVTTQDFNTDSLGTFSGEVARASDPISTAREKCLRASAVTGDDLILASEGSFGPHPTAFFIPADEEHLLLLDRANQLEITVSLLSTDTNFNAKAIDSWAELRSFAKSVGFPGHALILRPAKDAGHDLYKGITTEEDLRAAFDALQEAHGTVYAETDMRALFNPTRMGVIAQLTEKLVEKMLSCCPQCQRPGFGVTAAKRGLPCGLCRQPTQAVLSHVHSCAACAYTEEKMYPNQITTQDPMYCDRCNP